MKYRELKSRYKYQLGARCTVSTGITGPETISTEFIRLWEDGVLDIQRGYCWDGPSGPMVDTKTAMLASLVHDALYQLIRLGRVPYDKKEQVDDLFKEICRAQGMGKFRAWYARRALRLASPDKPEKGDENGWIEL